MITTKQELKQYILDYYDNDPRITDDLVFNGNELLENGYSLLMNTNDTNKNPYQNQCSVFINTQTITKVLGIKFPYYHRDKGWVYNDIEISGKEKDEIITNNIYPKIRDTIITKAKEFVGDTGCWYFFGWGYNNSDNEWCHLYLFSPNNVALDFMENDIDKAQYILQ